MFATYTLSLFTPGEAERITGLSVAMQRDWRHRGFLPKTEGHARFNVFDLASMLAMKLLSDRGVGPQASQAVAEWCAVGIVWEVLTDFEAWEGDHAAALSWIKRPDGMPRPTREDIQSVLRAIRVQNDLPPMSDEEVNDLVPPLNIRPDEWSQLEQCEWLTKNLYRQRGLKFTVAPYFIWWADNSHIFHVSLDRAFQDFTIADAQVSGAVVVLDLAALASGVMERSGRPLVHVEFARDEETGEIDPPLEYGDTVPLNPDCPS